MGFTVAGFGDRCRDGFPVDASIHLRENDNRVRGRSIPVWYRNGRFLLMWKYRGTCTDVGQRTGKLLQALLDVLFDMTGAPAGRLLINGDHSYSLCLHNPD